MITSRSTDDLSPATKAKADALVRTLARDSDIDLLIISTYRDLEAQALLYAQGRTAPGHIVTNAKAGFSFHNFRVAFDVVPLVNGKPLWQVFNVNNQPGEIWAHVVAVAASLDLEWGGGFVSIKDYDHFQCTNGITLAQFQAGVIAS